MVWQQDPLLCPRRGGTMRIISFITDQTVIDRILRHIGFKHADSPPARYHPPPQALSGTSRVNRERRVNRLTRILMPILMTLMENR